MAQFIATINDALNLTRQFMRDTNTSHRVAPDDLSQYVDTVRTVFPLSNQNVVVGNGTCKYIKDSGALTSLDPQDTVNSLLTVSPAPQVSLEVYYFYTYFNDAQVQQLFDSGLTEMSFTESNLSPDSSTPATIPEALYRAASRYAAAYGNQIMMENFVKQYNVTAEGQSYEKSSVYKAFKEAYTTNLADAERIKTAYWSNQSRSNRASGGTSSNRSYPGRGMQPGR